jgi:hypothetical protein
MQTVYPSLIHAIFVTKNNHVEGDLERTLRSEGIYLW